MNRIEIRRRANTEMEKRRQLALAEAESRRREIAAKLPQVGEVQKMLARTASELSALIVRRSGDYKESFEKIRSGSLSGRQMIRDALTANGYPEDYLEVHFRCRECGDTGYTERGMCGCMKRLIGRIAAEELNRTANMPAADFSHFDLSYYRNCVIDGRDCYEKMAGNLDFCIKYADSFSRSSKSLLMIGRTGVGKTHLSMSIAKELIANGFNVIYGSAVNLLENIEKEHFGREEGGDTLAALLDCDLLIIDDLGSEFHSSFYESALYNIINSRINMGLPAVISSNLTLDELYKTYNERIISRIAGYYEVLYLAGKDIRQLKRLNG
ncbi:MAG: ATP-binding protein [Ruminococcus sp.]|nr:ATP-binding protein [Ruminococcus sp.]